MSDAFPLDVGPEQVSIETWTPNFVSQAHNLRRQVSQRGGHRWLITVALPDNLTRAEAAQIFGFLVARRGQYNTFTFTPPVVATARGSAGGSPLVNGASQAGRTINTDG